jgi:hypothetical protein
MLLQPPVTSHHHRGCRDKTTESTWDLKERLSTRSLVVTSCLQKHNSPCMAMSCFSDGRSQHPPKTPQIHQPVFLSSLQRPAARMSRPGDVLDAGQNTSKARSSRAPWTRFPPHKRPTGYPPVRCMSCCNDWFRSRRRHGCSSPRSESIRRGLQ